MELGALAPSLNVIPPYYNSLMTDLTPCHHCGALFLSVFDDFDGELIARCEICDDCNQELIDMEW